MIGFIIVVLAVLCFLVIFLAYYVHTLNVRFSKLLSSQDGEDKNIGSVLDNLLSGLEKDKKTLEEIKTELGNLKIGNNVHIQNVGIIRFNPFSDTGGDQSFVLSILDGNHTGIILTSLHSRTGTRWYAKNIKEGKGVDYQLSKEEQQAIKEGTSKIKHI